MPLPEAINSRVSRGKSRAGKSTQRLSAHGPWAMSTGQDQGAVEAEMLTQGQARESSYWTEVLLSCWGPPTSAPSHPVLSHPSLPSFTRLRELTAQATPAAASILSSSCCLYLEHSTPLLTHQPHPLSWLNLFTPQISS